jgi:trimeric autotransporter adhesin
MKRKMAMFMACCGMFTSATGIEFNALADSVETVGVLNATDGVRFPDGNVQTSACSGCAELVPIDRGGTGGDTASEARTNLGVPGLVTPNTFTADQAIQGDISATGNLSIPMTTTTAGIIYAGSNTLMHTYGNLNFFAGENAGNLTMSGGYNTAIGRNALHANTTGNYNTANGYQALNANTEGYDNTAGGVYALLSNTSGFRNTAYGLNSLRMNTAGAYNTVSGYRALYNNTTAGKNTALGANALYTQSFSDSGSAWNSENTAVGFEALYANQPVTNLTGAWNTAIGSTSLRSNTTGFYNTATGVAALYSNESGFGNTASGYWALHNNTVGTDNTAVGRGTAAANSSGNYNTAVGVLAGNTITTGSNNTFVGYNSDGSANNLTNATAIGYGAIVNSDNMVRIGNTDVTVIQGQVDFSRVSDFRFKKDIEDIQQGLAFINALRPVQFRMEKGNDRIDFGFIAQDIQEILGTGYNVLGIDADADRTLSLRYTDFIAPMVKAMQEQQGIIESQKVEIKELKERLERIEALLFTR